MLAYRSIVEHEVLQRVMQTEPEEASGLCQVFQNNRIRRGIADFLVPFLEQRGVADGVDLKESADFLARMVLSYMSSPGRWDLDDPVQVARLVRSELLAGVVAPEPGPGPGRGPASAGSDATDGARGADADAADAADAGSSR